MKEHLKFYKDFPKKGIVFVDIIPFLRDKQLFTQLCGEFGNGWYGRGNSPLVAGMQDSQGRCCV